MTPADMIALLDDAWDHQWESMAYAIEGVTVQEAAFQHPAYSAEVCEAGMPLPGTILWHMAHLAHLDQYYARVIEQRPNKPAIPDGSAWKTLDDCRAAMTEHRGALAAALRKLPADGGQELVGNGNSVDDFVRACARHVTWHAAQIAVARRLSRTSGA